MINHLTYDKNKVLCPIFANSEVLLCDTKQFFFRFALYLDYDSTGYMWYNNVKCCHWNVLIACLKTIILWRLTARRSVFVRCTFFKFSIQCFRLPGCYTRKHTKNVWELCVNDVSCNPRICFPTKFIWLSVFH